MRPLLAGLFLQAEKAPNILSLFADDLGRYASAYPDPSNPSPNDIVATPSKEDIANIPTKPLLR